MGGVLVENIVIEFMRSANNIAISTLFLMVFFLMYIVLRQRTEDREDKKVLTQIVADNTEALLELKGVINERRWAADRSHR
jgi:hypothetical protein